MIKCINFTFPIPIPISNKVKSVSMNLAYNSNCRYIFCICNCCYLKITCLTYIFIRSFVDCEIPDDLPKNEFKVKKDTSGMADNSTKGQ